MKPKIGVPRPKLLHVSSEYPNIRFITRGEQHNVYLQNLQHCKLQKKFLRPFCHLSQWIKSDLLNMQNHYPVESVDSAIRPSYMRHLNIVPTSRQDVY